MDYLGLCCIVKDETPFLEEWIAYHTLLGVEKFVIYDNGSRIPVAHTLRHLLNEHFVTVHRVPGVARQIPCYNHCLTEHGSDFVWLGFLDMDEFAVPKKTGDLRVMLTEFESSTGFASNWMPFGCGGHRSRPQGLQIEKYTLSMPNWEHMTRHVKVFVRPPAVRTFHNPHMVIPRALPVVNERHEMVSGPFSFPPSWQTCQINHYYYRSYQDYNEKLHRRMADSNRRHAIPKKIAPPDGDVPDLSAAVYAPAVHSLLRHMEQGACAALAAAPEVPDTPELALTQIADHLSAWRLLEGLSLLCKARARFPGNALLDDVARRSRSLLEQLDSPAQETLG